MWADILNIVYTADEDMGHKIGTDHQMAGHDEAHTSGAMNPVKTNGASLVATFQSPTYAWRSP